MFIHLPFLLPFSHFPGVGLQMFKSTIVSSGSGTSYALLSTYIESIIVDGWMDGFTSGYRVATALRIVYWPSLSILGGDASRLVRLFQLTIPPKVTICRESIIMLIEGKCNLVTRATLHNSYEFKVVKSLPVSRVRT